MSEPEEQSPPAPAPTPSLSWGTRLTLVLGLLAGPVYLAWVAGIEGRKIWVVLGLILLVAGCATLAHRLMAMTRR